MCGDEREPERFCGGWRTEDEWKNERLSRWWWWEQHVYSGDEERVSGGLSSPFTMGIEVTEEGELHPRASAILATGLTCVVCAHPYWLRSKTVKRLVWDHTVNKAESEFGFRSPYLKSCLCSTFLETSILKPTYLNFLNAINLKFLFSKGRMKVSHLKHRSVERNYKYSFKNPSW